MSVPACPFCAIEPEQVLIACPLALARHDLFPVSKGHTLIIPRRHVASFFESEAGFRKTCLRTFEPPNARRVSVAGDSPRPARRRAVDRASAGGVLEEALTAVRGQGSGASMRRNRFVKAGQQPR